MSELPGFSIVIPTRNRPQRLDECLRAICRLDYPKDKFDVIVADDASATATSDVVNTFRETLDIQLAAAVKALQGKLQDGKWASVGGDGVAELTRAREIDRLRKLRESINERLSEIDKRIDKLGKSTFEKFENCMCAFK